MTHILISWFKEGIERRKASFRKETVENADLDKAILNKTMTTQQWCVSHLLNIFVEHIKAICWQWKSFSEHIQIIC